MFVRTLPEFAQKALAILGQSKIFDFAYMAGGSSLALQLGHRSSEDFDFFCQNKFDENEIRAKLQGIGDYKVDHEAENTMLGYFNGVKFSLFWYRNPLVVPTIDFEGLSLAGKEDIAAMKLQAILGRATKKDYVDLCFLMKKGLTIGEMLRLYDRKYDMLEENKLMLVRGLQYFEDAETSEMPVMFEPLSWEQVKEFLRGEAGRYWRAT